MAAPREWDSGKEQWAQQHTQWDDGSSKMRAREDDEYAGDGKRRKHNDGSWEPGEGEGEGPTDWSLNKPRKRLVPSEPSEHVIFLGLDTDFNETDLTAYLAGHGCTVESVTIIRDRSTGLSKGFGFAQFASPAHAAAFVTPFFPFVQVPPPASHGAGAAAAFYRALAQGGPHAGRRVKIDFSQSAHPAARAPANDGTRDIGAAPCATLLVRGLDPQVGPAALATALRAAQGPGTEGAKGMTRIVVIKDKTSLAGWGFAFVEFVDIPSASAVLGASMSATLHPAGFRVADKPAALSFAQAYSFAPVDPMHRDEACLRTPAGGWARYWDPASTVAVAEFEVEAPREKEREKERERKKRKVEKPAAAPEASLLPVSDKPVTLSFKGGLALAKPAGGAKPGPSTAFGDDDDSDGGDAEADAHAAKVAAARRVAPMIASKKTANNINKWNQVQEVLSAVPAAAAAPAPAQAAPVAVPTPAPAQAAPVAAAEPEAPAEDSDFSDAAGKVCLLCARQFKTPEQTRRHTRESDLHKKNMQDGALRDAARAKVLAARSAPAAAEAPKYRDRASERRVMHNQPDAPMPEVAAVLAPAKAKAPSPPAPPGKDEANVGNKLLKMMGWKEGEGLGQHGEGIAEPIQTAVFAAGVGLGASKGAEIGKHPEGYAGYLSKGKDMARERYGKSD